MATYSRVTPTGWSQGDDASASSRVTPTGWEQVAAAAGGGALTLDLNAGNYTLTGQSADLTVAKQLDLNAGSYALTGQSATLSVGKLLEADAGSYTLTGYSAELTWARQLDLNAGSYTLSGQSADLTYTPVGGKEPLNADAGSYTLTGYSADLTWARKLDLDAGAYTLTGQDVTLAKGAGGLDLNAGSYTLTGYAVTLTWARQLDLEAGSYSIGGQSAVLTYSEEPEPVVETRKRGGASRFVEARKRLPMPFLIDWLTNDEPSEATKRVITEIKAGRPIPTDVKPPKGPENISAERLAREILPNRAFVYKTYLADLVQASRTVEKAVELARERDDEDVLLLL